MMDGGYVTHTYALGNSATKIKITGICNTITMRGYEGRTYSRGTINKY